MQQRYLYMRPALQPSEAVLLPALPRFRWTDPPEPVHIPLTSGFIPVTGDWNGQTTALSTQVRTPGSMAGRGVLRAVGVGNQPFAWRTRPRYHRSTGRKTIPASLR